MRTHSAHHASHGLTARAGVDIDAINFATKHTTKAPAKGSQHVNATYRNDVGRNMLRAFGHRVGMCCDMLGVFDSGLKMVKFKPRAPNTSQQLQQLSQMHATCCAQQCCDMLRWHVAIVWPGLKIKAKFFYGDQIKFNEPVLKPRRPE